MKKYTIALILASVLLSISFIEKYGVMKDLAGPIVIITLLFALKNSQGKIKINDNQSTV